MSVHSSCFFMDCDWITTVQVGGADSGKPSELGKAFSLLFPFPFSSSLNIVIHLLFPMIGI